MLPIITSKAAEEERPEPLSTFEVVYAQKPPILYPSFKKPWHIPAMMEAEVPNLAVSGVE